MESESQQYERIRTAIERGGGVYAPPERAARTDSDAARREAEEAVKNMWRGEKHTPVSASFQNPGPVTSGAEIAKASAAMYPTTGVVWGGPSKGYVPAPRGDAAGTTRVYREDGAPSAEEARRRALGEIVNAWRKGVAA